jgi:hypothetical protein
MRPTSGRMRRQRHAAPWRSDPRDRRIVGYRRCYGTSAGQGRSPAADRRAGPGPAGRGGPDTGALALKADLAEPQGPAELADAALQVASTDAHAPGIDILINNAGVGWCGPVGEMSGDKIAEVLAVNLAAPIELTRRLLPRMTARGSGRIVFKRRGRPYGRSKPEPLPAERAAEAIRSALEHDRQVVYVPRWMSFPARLHGAAPRTFALLAHWFGDHGLAGPPGWNSGLPGGPSSG